MRPPVTKAKAAARAAREQAARQAGRAGLPGKRPVPASEYCRVKAAAARLADARAAAAAARAADPDGQARTRNVTGPDSRLMPVRGGGFLQGYNAQAGYSAGGLCPGTLVTQDTTGYASFAPMAGQAEAASALLRAGARGPVHRKRARIGTILAGAGSCSQASLGCPGPDRLIATGQHRDLEHAAAARPATGGRGGDLTTAMAARLAGFPGLAAYRKRSPLAEGPFGNIKHNRGFRRFCLRGLARASSEWSFQNAAGNLLKIHATRWQPSQA